MIELIGDDAQQKAYNGVLFGDDLILKIGHYNESIRSLKNKPSLSPPLYHYYLSISTSSPLFAERHTERFSGAGKNPGNILPRGHGQRSQMVEGGIYPFA